MKFVSFNINGLRAHFHQLKIIMTKWNPDIIGLQETKIHNGIFPVSEILEYGYYSYFNGHKNYYGVALLSRIPPISVYYDLNINNDENKEMKFRIIIADFQTNAGLLTIINSYAPQGENIHHPIKFPMKERFYYILLNYIKKYHNKPSYLLIMGDMNISPTDLDVGINEKQRKIWIKHGKCAFLLEERTWINNLLSFGLVDIYRKIYPFEDFRYSWFDYRSKSFQYNRGLRIDLFLSSSLLSKKIQEVGIDYTVRAMMKPSDHAPVWAIFDI